MRSVRQHHNTVVVDGSLFIIGGFDNSTSKYLDSCEIFDYLNGCAGEKIDNLNMARSNFGICFSEQNK